MDSNNNTETIKQNRRLLLITVGIICAVLIGIIIYNLFGLRKETDSKLKLITSIHDADRLLEKNMPQEALKIYNALLEDIPEKEEPEKMGHIRHMIGRCYDKLAAGSNTKENLARAIQSYETVLEIRILEKYPVLHKVIISNMVSTLNALDN